MVSSSQAISVSTIRQHSHDTLSFYPQTTPTLPPQLAYYVASGVNLGSDYSVPDTIPKNVQSQMVKQRPTKVKQPVGAQSTRIIVRDMSPLSEILHNLQQEPVMINRYTSSKPKVVNKAYQQKLPRSQRFGFIGNYRPSARQFGMNDLVRATGPPPGPNDPPPPKRLFIPTFQINQLQRNYRQQQMIDQQTPKRIPNIRNMVMIEVKPPNLGPVYNQYQPRVNPIIPQINYLREQQRHHFGIDQDEHPAQLPNQNHISPLDPDYNVYSNGLGIYNDQVEEHNHIKHDYPSNEQSEPIRNYDQLHKEFLQGSSFNNDKDHYGSLKHHTDPFEKTYQNYVDETTEDYDKGDSSKSNYQYQSPINGEYQKYLAEAPSFVKPVNYASYIDRSGNTAAPQRQTESDFVPYQMLASVRHRERVIHRSKEEAKEPTVKERIQEEGGHVVYTEQGYEDKQYDHGDEERFAAFKKKPDETRQRRKKRSAHRTLREFPYYFMNPDRLPELSALRYAETQGRRARGAENFYDTKPLDCEHIDFDDSTVNDEEMEITKKRRLQGLGNKIDCYKQKYFGEDPFSNPIFKERLVSDQASFRFKRSLEDDSKINIPSSTSSNYTTNDKQMPPLLNTSTTASLYHKSEHPTVILLSDKSLAKIKANPSMHISDILQYPEIQNSEVFIFDISKFIPRLFINDHLQEIQTSKTTSKPHMEFRNRRKTIRKTVAKRPSNHNTNSN